MNEYCWIGILEQFLHCITVGGSKWVIEAERHNSSVSLPHKMQILKLCVGRKREGIHHLSCSSFCSSQVCLLWPVAKLPICCILDWYLGEPSPSPHFIMKRYHKIIPKPVSIDTFYIFSLFCVSWDVENLLPCCVWQGEYTQISSQVSLSLFIPNLFCTRGLLCQENWVLLC